LSVAAFLEVLESPYFGRLWSFQELLLAGEICFLLDRQALTATKFYDTARFLSMLHYSKWNDSIQLPTWKARYPASRISRLLKQALLFSDAAIIFKQRPLHLTELLDWTKHLYCPLNYEKFYALLQLLSKTDSAKLGIDYRKPVLSQFVRAVIFCVEQSKSLDILCISWAPSFESYVSASTELKPTWLQLAPADGGLDTAQPLVDFNHCLRVHVRRSAYSASGQAQAETRLGLCRMNGPRPSLFVHGYILDQVSQTTDLALNGVVPQSWSKFADWQNITESPPEQFWRTMVVDRDENGCRVSNFYARVFRTIFSHLPPRAHLDTNAVEVESTSSILQQVVRNIRNSVNGRRLWKTSRSLIGLGHEDVQSGDVVCILLGCSVPVVLRKIQHLEDAYKHYFEFVGEGYVHGMMDGEAMKYFEENGIEKQELELR